MWGRAVHCRLFHPARPSEYRRQGLNAEGRTRIIHVGRIALEKDLETLIGGLRQAHEVLGDRAVFCIAGEGLERERVRRALPFATHLGFVRRDRLADLYADADLFLFTSPTETCGLVVLERWRRACRVIAADAGGVRDNVRDGITGRLLPPGDPYAFGRVAVELVEQYESLRARAA